MKYEEDEQYDEAAFPVFPTLAIALGGSDEALVFQQIKYWVTFNKRTNKNFYEGKYWVYNTYEQWQRDIFHLTKRSIERIFVKLEKLKVITVGRFNKHSTNRTKWYSINHEVVRKLIAEAEKKVDAIFLEVQQLENKEDVESPSPQNGGLEDTKRGVGKPQNAELINTPKVGIGTPQNGGLYSTDITNSDHNKKNTNNNTRAREEKSNANPSIDLAVDNSLSELVNKNLTRFDMFWADYPHKVGKGAAKKAFLSAMKKTSLASILEAIEAQKLQRYESVRLGIWVPSWTNPAVWLNQERWDDVIKTTEELEAEAKASLKNSSSKNQLASQEAKEREERMARIRARAEAASRRSENAVL